MRKKYFLTYTNEKGEDGGGFYLNGKDVTAEWYNFFSGISMEQERDCERIFIRRYAKKLLQVTK